ncbi:hypothetical protein D3C81_1125320 [compost metagenome]
MGLREAQVWASLGQPEGHLLGGADRGGRFQNDQVALFQYWGDGFARGLDVAQVRLVVVHERRRHGDQEGVSGFRYGGGTQEPFGHSGVNDHVQLRLDDVDLTAVDGVDRVLVNVDADNMLLAGGKNGGRWQADIAQTYDRNLVEAHAASLELENTERASRIRAHAFPSP